MTHHPRPERLAISTLTEPAQALLNATAHLTDATIVAARARLTEALQSLHDTRTEDSSQDAKRDQGMADHPYPMG